MPVRILPAPVLALSVSVRLAIFYVFLIVFVSIIVTGFVLSVELPPDLSDLHSLRRERDPLLEGGEGQPFPGVRRSRAQRPAAPRTLPSPAPAPE